MTARPAGVEDSWAHNLSRKVDGCETLGGAHGNGPSLTTDFGDDYRFDNLTIAALKRCGLYH